MIAATKKNLSGFVLIIFIVAQFATMFSILLVPKQAEAFGPSITVADIPRIIFQVATAAGERIAVDVANKFLSRFINALDQKYKIRSYLYYDQVLTDYYLSNYISDKIQDPDLRQIYGLLDRGFITGQSTGTSNAPNPNNALIPKLNAAISNYYLKIGGIDPNNIYNPSPSMTDAQYFAMAQAYFVNPPSFTEQNLRGQFGAFQSSATTAAQLEVIVGNGLKAGRVVGGTCSIDPSDNTYTPASCTAAGGTWQASALDNLRSLISNPAGTVNKWLDSVIKQYIDTNYNSKNYTTVIGSLLGNYLFNQFTNTGSDPVLQETSAVDSRTNPGVGTSTKELDIDGDGTMDGLDVDGNGQLDNMDVCYFGGIPDPTTGSSTAGPPCQGSKAALTNPTPPTPTGPTCETNPNNTACNSSDHTDVVTRVKNYLIGKGQQFNTFCDAFEITKRVAWALRGEGGGLLATIHSTQCNGYAAGDIAYTDNSFVDILIGVGNNTDGPAWQPGPPSTEAGVYYVPPTDPGDPAGSY